MPDDAKLVMSGFVQGTVCYQELCGHVLPYPEILASWASVWAVFQSAKAARKAWN
jgi:hypothetical protein